MKKLKYLSILERRLITNTISTYNHQRKNGKWYKPFTTTGLRAPNRLCFKCLFLLN
jgi:hypothetical protein